MSEQGLLKSSPVGQALQEEPGVGLMVVTVDVQLRGLSFRRLDGRAISLGPDAVVITPGGAKVFLDGLADESRIIRDAEDLMCFCNEITADPRWSTRPSSNRATPTG